MSSHPLDRSIWNALISCQSEFAVGTDAALRFASDIGPLAAARDESADALRALAEIIPEQESIILLELPTGEAWVPPQTVAEKIAEGVQMVAEGIAPVRSSALIERLTDGDATEMLSLATLTEPGPFRSRTHRLGTFWGIREEGRLVAMAGERLKLPGFTEVSGVCTHPDARGRGYAAALSHKVATLILERGDKPFLHAYAANEAAIGLYRSLGFEIRCPVTVTVLRRA